LSGLGQLLNRWMVNLKRLFHLLIALIFMGLTLLGVSQTYVAWQEFKRAPDVQINHIIVWVYGVFTVSLAALCLYTFAKAKSVR
jgi:uncharacterized membrane protein YraQ (UPF0718 family)